MTDSSRSRLVNIGRHMNHFCTNLHASRSNLSSRTVDTYERWLEWVRKEQVCRLIWFIFVSAVAAASRRLFALTNATDPLLRPSCSTDIACHRNLTASTRHFRNSLRASNLRTFHRTFLLSRCIGRHQRHSRGHLVRIKQPRAASRRHKLFMVCSAKHQM
jgi:hypothetical protein